MKDHKIELMSCSEITRCGACHRENLRVTFDFGEVPLAGYFPKPDEPLLPLLPMRLLYCEDCTLHQISPNISDNDLFEDYRYVSSIGMQVHFNELADWFETTQKPATDCRIVEFGCNDGPLLTALTALGFSPIGIDPAKNIVELAKGKGLSVINDFFGEDALIRYEDLQNVDYIFSSNSFAHITDIHSIAKTIAKSLAPDGKFIVEVQSLIRLVESNAFDFVYHEHKYYYTLQSLSNLLSQFDLNLVDCMETPIHGGSYRLVFQKSSTRVSLAAKTMLERELKFKLSSQELEIAILNYRNELRKLNNFLLESYQLGKRVVAFGASGRANMLLGAMPAASEIINIVIDQSPERIGRLMAQNSIPIVDFDAIDCDEYDVVIILAWNFADSIMAKWRNKQSIFVVPLPNFQTIESV